jgi:hypothetical protein
MYRRKEKLVEENDEENLAKRKAAQAKAIEDFLKWKESETESLSSEEILAKQKEAMDDALKEIKKCRIFHSKTGLYPSQYTKLSNIT